MFHSARRRRGVTLIEVVIGVSIAALVLVFTTHALMQFVNVGRDVSEKTAALYLAEEGLELIRFERDEAWSEISGLSTASTHYLNATTTGVAITNSPETIDGFSRSFRIQNVYRNSSTDDIVASTTAGSVADTSAKYITVTVSWASGAKSVSLTSILANLDP